jgi:beta-glucosidase
VRSSRSWTPGDYGARAIADVLSGDFNPSGRLPFTWPRHPSAHLTHDCKHSELVGEGFNPQYAFGDGLSYSPVKTTDLNIMVGSRAKIGDTVTVEVTLQNTGDRSTTETVIVYSQDRVASITPSVDELAAYKQVVVPAGATSKVSLDVHTDDLGFIGLDNTYIVEPGAFGLRVKDKTVEFELMAP